LFNETQDRSIINLEALPADTCNGELVETLFDHFGFAENKKVSFLH